MVELPSSLRPVPPTAVWIHVIRQSCRKWLGLVKAAQAHASRQHLDCLSHNAWHEQLVRVTRAVATPDPPFLTSPPLP
eukprot:1182322-Pyramimonas_sp.AAC.1